jgi:Epoxide hydrolase N terminus
LVPGWQAGTDPVELARLVEYWRTGYGWRAQEAAINALPSHFVDIDGNPVHFLLYEGEHPDALAIVLTHGWPSSFLEMPALAAHLAAPSRHGGDRADAFIGIVPSLPGFAFSPQRASLPAQVPTHQIWHRLMCRSSTNDQRGPSRQGGCLVGEWERTAAALTEYWQPRMLPARVAEIWDARRPSLSGLRNFSRSYGRLFIYLNPALPERLVEELVVHEMVHAALGPDFDDEDAVNEITDALIRTDALAGSAPVSAQARRPRLDEP